MEEYKISIPKAAIVCDEANQPQYIFSAPEYGKLKVESVSDDFVRIYEYVSHTKEQWVYGQGYIYLTDGIVTAIQMSE